MRFNYYTGSIENNLTLSVVMATNLEADARLFAQRAVQHD